MLEGKRVLVTGAGGFIGSHLVEALLDKGCKVRAFVHYNSFNRWGWLDYLDESKKDSVEIFAGDVSAPNGVRASMRDIDIVFHLAALIGIPYSYHSPESYVETNIKGTLNVLQGCMDFGVGKVLVTSTSEVYGTAKYVPMDEEHPRQGQSPYSATKIGADSLAESFYRSFDLPVVIVRPFNTYGPRQSARAIVPTIISQLICGSRRLRLGSLHPTRDLVYVKDVVEGFVEIAESKVTAGEQVNIATQTEISIGELAQKLIDMLGVDAEVVRDDERLRPENSEVERLLGGNEKIKKLTNWSPRYSLEEGLTETIEWFRTSKHLELYKPEIYNV
jgi:NAD dependent epimerase/dehydratase